MINIKEDKDLSVLNHSCAHVMANAVRNLYPNVKFWVGPVIEEGFYYDMDLGDVSITDEDIVKIEREMKKVVKDGKRIIRNVLTKEEALEKFANDEYKIDLINNFDANAEITCYSQGSFTDLCRGPHVESVKECKYFKLLKFSGAYWKGDSSNKVLQRIYGVCFRTEDELKKHLEILEEAKLRDHRKIGKDLKIFMTHDLVGKGLPMYLPNGYIIWEALENYIKDKEKKANYQHVLTPPLGNVELYKTSGHWDHYKDNMFPKMSIEDEEFVLRPMNCPHHMMIYANEIHSYRDLPIRIGEIARDCRYEASGALKGIERVRCMCQNDAHLFVTKEQIKSEFKNVVNLILEVYKELDITNYRFELSLRDPGDKKKYYDDDKMWENAENELREILVEMNLPFVEKIGEAAFYGPKLDVQVKPAVGNEYTLSTCQIDFCLPMKFDLNYIDKEGHKQTPVVLHRAVFGTIDRFMAYYLEETKGFLPLWMAPTQVNIIPVNNSYHLEYAEEIFGKLKELNMRIKLDDRDEKLGYKIRESQLYKYPVTLVLGQNEVDNKNISYRLSKTGETKNVSYKEFVNNLELSIKNKKDIM